MIFMAGLCKKDCAHPFYRCERVRGGSTVVSVCECVCVFVCALVCMNLWLRARWPASFMLSYIAHGKVHMNSRLALYSRSKIHFFVFVCVFLSDTSGEIKCHIS